MNSRGEITISLSSSRSAATPGGGEKIEQHNPTRALRKKFRFEGQKPRCGHVVAHRGCRDRVRPTSCTTGRRATPVHDQKRGFRKEFGAHPPPDPPRSCRVDGQVGEGGSVKRCFTCTMAMAAAAAAMGSDAYGAHFAWTGKKRIIRRNRRTILARRRR